MGKQPQEVTFARVTVAGLGLKLSLSHQVPLLTRAFSKQEKSDNYLQGSKQLLYLKYKDAKDQAFEIAMGKYGRWQEKDSLLNLEKSQMFWVIIWEDMNLACNQIEWNMFSLEKISHSM